MPPSSETQMQLWPKMDQSGFTIESFFTKNTTDPVAPGDYSP